MAVPAVPIPAAPPAPSPLSAGDTAWVLVSAALVLLMTPGLAFFYGGLVRRKNVLSVLMQCFVVICILSVQWVVFGYSLSFGPDVKGIIGSLGWAGLRNVGAEPFPAYAATIPHSVFMIFQAMFAVITPALILGAFAERMRFSAFCLFILLWATFVYDPVAHWVWSAGGFLSRIDAGGNIGRGAADFAGGTVVHINAGIAALVAALVLGRRVGSVSPPHSLPFAVLGAGLLWFGWFGFNAGSALAADGIAANAFVTTHLAAAAATLSWIVAEWFHNGKPTTLGAASGCLAGLVAITPAAGFVGPMDSIIMGLLAGVICYGGIMIKKLFNYDDALDVVGIHGVGGTFGALGTGLFASGITEGKFGLFYGNPGQLWVQFVTVVGTWVFCFVMSVILFKLVDKTLGLRAGEEEEVRGLDITQHSETGYQM